MKELADLLGRVKAQSPLTLVITNQVTIGDCANALLAIGAAPVMSNDPDDARDLAALAAAAVLNIGTVSASQLEILQAAGQGARAAGRPVVLDPVGVGATAVRWAAARALLQEVRPGLIRGNWAEIQALAGLDSIQRGVDSASGEDLAAVAAVAKDLAGRLQAVVAVTGAVDVAASFRQTWLIGGGSPLLTRLTGTGCLLSAMVGAYAAVAGPGELELAAAGALAHLALAGQRAAESLGQTPLLGTFKVRLFDALATVSLQDLAQSGPVSQK
jgi:hydroxyethylthiazole kinase